MITLRLLCKTKEEPVYCCQGAEQPGGFFFGNAEVSRQCRAKEEEHAAGLCAICILTSSGGAQALGPTPCCFYCRSRLEGFVEWKRRAERTWSKRKFQRWLEYRKKARSESGLDIIRHRFLRLID